MCARFNRDAVAKILASLYSAESHEELLPQINIRPTDPVAVVRVLPTGQRELVQMRWGLIPPKPAWATEAALKEPRFNARAETVATKPTYREAFKARRCLIPASTFNEKKSLIGMKDGNLFAMAGLWESYTAATGKVIESCTIITTTPNAFMAPIHHRMPVILEPEDFDRWLDPNMQDTGQLQELLCPCADEKMAAHDAPPEAPRPKKKKPAKEKQDDGQGMLF